MGWIGVDLDGTLAHYDGWKGPTVIGKPIPAMVKRVKEWLLQRQEVRIFTARVYPLGYIPKTQLPPGHPNIFQYECAVAWEAAVAIKHWCIEHIGQPVDITCVKDYKMWQLWDDRAIQVEQNTGRRMDELPKGETTP